MLTLMVGFVTNRENNCTFFQIVSYFLIKKTGTYVLENIRTGIIQRYFKVSKLWVTWQELWVTDLWVKFYTVSKGIESTKSKVTHQAVL